MTSHELANILLSQPDLQVWGAEVTQGHADDNDGGDDAAVESVEFPREQDWFRYCKLHFED